MTNSAMKKVYRFLAFLVYAAPMTTLLLVRYDRYTHAAGSLGFFGILIIMFCALFFGAQMFEKAKKKPLMSVSIALFVFAVITRYMSVELLWVTAVSTAASVLSEFVNVVADVYENYEWKVVDGIKTKNLDKALPQKEAWAQAYGIKAK